MSSFHDEHNSPSEQTQPGTSVSNVEQPSPGASGLLADDVPAAQATNNAVEPAALASTNLLGVDHGKGNGNGNGDDDNNKNVAHAAYHDHNVCHNYETNAAQATTGIEITEGQEAVGTQQQSLLTLEQSDHDQQQYSVLNAHGDSNQLEVHDVSQTGQPYPPVVLNDNTAGEILITDATSDNPNSALSPAFATTALIAESITTQHLPHDSSITATAAAVARHEIRQDEQNDIGLGVHENPVSLIDGGAIPQDHPPMPDLNQQQNETTSLQSTLPINQTQQSQLPQIIVLSGRKTASTTTFNNNDKQPGVVHHPTIINGNNISNNQSQSHPDASNTIQYDQTNTITTQPTSSHTTQRALKQDQWDYMLEQLQTFKDEHGHCKVPKRYENSKLGTWVETQRVQFRKLWKAANHENDDLLLDHNFDPTTLVTPSTRLNAERMEKLQNLGFCWSLRRSTNNNSNMKTAEPSTNIGCDKNNDDEDVVMTCHGNDNKETMTMANTFVAAETGKDKEHMLVDSSILMPMATTTGGGDIINPSQSEHANSNVVDGGLMHDGTEDTHTQSSVTQYAAANTTSGSSNCDIGKRKTYDEQWDEMFLRLKRYKEENGNALVPKRHANDPQLGTWVDTQRVQYKIKLKLEQSKKSTEQCRLTDERIRCLESVGFEWSCRDDWKKHYNELVEFKKETGHCNVPARYTNRRLGLWVTAQRQRYKRLNQNQDAGGALTCGPLNAGRIDLLNELGFVWSIRSRSNSDTWNLRFEALKEFKRKHGHCLVPARHKELGTWCGTQRTQYRKLKSQGKDAKCSMTDERIRKLEDIGFVWIARPNKRNNQPMWMGNGSTLDL